MRALFAIFMVVLIGNPVCCCAFDVPEERPEAIPSDLPSCCQARLAQRSDSRDSDEKEKPLPRCPCAAKLGFVTAEKAVAPPPLPVKGIPAILAAADSSGFDLGKRAVFEAGSAPGTVIPAFPPPPRLLYGVFRC